MARPVLPVTPPVIEAMRRGMSRKGWGPTHLGRAIGQSKQLIANILNGHSQRSAYLVDILKALDEPLYNVLELNAWQRELLELTTQMDEAGLPSETRDDLVADFRRRVAGEVARAELARRPK